MPAVSLLAAAANQVTFFDVTATLGALTAFLTISLASATLAFRDLAK